MKARPDATLADVDALGDDARVELIDGVLYTLPMPTQLHGHIAKLIATDLTNAYERGRGGPGGWHFQVDNEFVIGGELLLRPDVAGWRAGKRSRG